MSRPGKTGRSNRGYVIECASLSSVRVTKSIKIHWSFYPVDNNAYHEDSKNILKFMLWSHNNEYRVSWLRSLTISLTVVCTLWLGFHSPQSHSFFLGPGSGSGTVRAITKSRLSMNEAPGPGAGSALHQPLILYSGWQHYALHQHCFTFSMDWRAWMEHCTTVPLCTVIMTIRTMACVMILILPSLIISPVPYKMIYKKKN